MTDLMVRHVELHHDRDVGRVHQPTVDFFSTCRGAFITSRRARCPRTCLHSHLPARAHCCVHCVLQLLPASRIRRASAATNANGVLSSPLLSSPLLSSPLLCAALLSTPLHHISDSSLVGGHPACWVGRRFVSSLGPLSCTSHRRRQRCAAGLDCLEPSAPAACVPLLYACLSGPLEP